MKRKNIYIIIGIIIIALYVFFVLAPDKRGVDSQVREVTLYFSTDNALYLAGEKRMVKTDNLYENTVKELIAGPESPELGKTIPAGTELINIRLENNIALLNFNDKFQKNHWGGSTGERMTVYSLVNTLTQFGEIEKVQILIEGKEIETLAGHLDLSKPLAVNESLLKIEE